MPQFLKSDFSAIDLTDEQQELFDNLERFNNSVFVTGKAGTGKSLLLQYFRTFTHKTIVVLAPTGVAALNVGGQTIHSLFRLPFSVITPEKMLELRLTTPQTKLLRNLDTMIIDEISMVRVDVLEAIDFLLKKARNSELPFGGVQMVLFGDLYQLPPVVTSSDLHSYFIEKYGGEFCFNATSWQELNPKIIELSTIFRQTDRTFVDVLNAVRHGNPKEELLQKLNARADVEHPAEGSIILATTNSAVTKINSIKVAELSGKTFLLHANISGDIEKSAFPTDEILELKHGAQIMMMKNDPDKRWVNGSLGIIHSISEDVVKVKIDGFVYKVEPEIWNKIAYEYNSAKKKIEEKIIGTFTQHPLRLAWAITIHKSQGQTYSSVIIDLGWGAFAHGQTYVALSRCEKLETLYLRRQVRPRDIIVNKSVRAFMGGEKLR
ncbi:MAG: PIF1 family ATP-dependent DNA helicase [Microgenomates group bacterium]